MNNKRQLTQNFVILDKLGDDLKVPVRYSNKAKHFAIKINHKGVELVLPNNNFDVGYQFLIKKDLPNQNLKSNY